MAKVKLYRFTDTGTMCLQVTNGAGNVSRHSLPITLTADQWDGKQVTSAHPQRMEVNAYLNGILSEAQLALSTVLREMPTKDLKASVIRDLIVAKMFHTEDVEEKQPVTFLDAYDAFTRSHNHKRTREIYEITRKRICEYDARVLTFEMITKKWLDGFNAWLSKRSPSVNARALHLRNIRAAFNYALDEEMTEVYPFRRYKIKREETIHRDLTPEDLRILFSYKPPTEKPNPHYTKPLDYAVKYVDIAKLIFLTIGMNPVDLFNAKPLDYYGGRINYVRAKTHKIYNIKVEPEAAALIRKYRGDKRLLSMCDNRDDYRSLCKVTNAALRKVSKELGLPPVTLYWMRHSWSTIAYTIGASQDMVSDALGHKHGATVTATYINKGRIFHSIDELNRAVIDYVLYEKE